MKQRINSMFMGDIIFAAGIIAVLWVVVIYVFLHTTDVVTNGTVSTVLMIGGGLVLLFNTASITAMISQYSREKDFIYGLDIRHLDEMREAKAKAAQQSNQGA